MGQKKKTQDKRIRQRETRFPRRRFHAAVWSQHGANPSGVPAVTDGTAEEETGPTGAPKTSRVELREATEAPGAEIQVEEGVFGMMVSITHGVWDSTCKPLPPKV